MSKKSFEAFPIFGELGNWLTAKDIPNLARLSPKELNKTFNEYQKVKKLYGSEIKCRRTKQIWQKDFGGKTNKVVLPKKVTVFHH